jgi:hypothetical protein
MVAYTCNPTTQLRQEDYEFKASLSYTVSPCLKIKSGVNLTVLAGKDFPHSLQVVEKHFIHGYKTILYVSKYLKEEERTAICPPVTKQED